MLLVHILDTTELGTLLEIIIRVVFPITQTCKKHVFPISTVEKIWTIRKSSKKRGRNTQSIFLRFYSVFKKQKHSADVFGAPACGHSSGRGDLEPEAPGSMECGRDKAAVRDRPAGGCEGRRECSGSVQLHTLKQNSRRITRN